MLKQYIFIFSLLITLLAFGYTSWRFIRFFRLTRPAFPVRNIGRRFGIMIDVAFGQTKIFRRPVMGLLHALVFWGFCVILIGSIEMVIDGVSGSEKVLSFLGIVYDIIMATGDIFALLIVVAIIVFLVRRLFLNVKRFSGIEMKHISHVDANIALTLILLLMISLLGMNTFYIRSSLDAGHGTQGFYPVTQVLASWISTVPRQNILLYEVNWWVHILLIFIFANFLRAMFKYISSLVFLQYKISTFPFRCLAVLPFL